MLLSIFRAIRSAVASWMRATRAGVPRRMRSRAEDQRGAGPHFEFADAIVRYASAYADQVERDFAEFTRATRAGRLRTDVGDADMDEFLP